MATLEKIDCLLPCESVKKLWASKDKMVPTILDSRKILNTDEAFAELGILNYWERWTSTKSAQWMDTHGGNTHFRGWSNDAYQSFDEVCKRIKKQLASKESKAVEETFLEYATEQHNQGIKPGRSGIQKKDQSCLMN
jgi:hypothetical protein